VISVEPQVDLCMSARASAELNGFQAVIFCGGASPHNETQRRLSFQKGYAGLHRESAIPPQFHSLLPEYAPTYALDEIVSWSRMKIPYFVLAKIDTDSIDCPLVDSLLERIEAKTLIARNIIFEGFSCQPAELAEILFRASRLRYQVFRLCMHCYSPEGQEVSSEQYPAATRKGVSLPPQTTVLYFQRFMKELWKFEPRYK